jgi:arylsulfatase A-like enzyme
MELESTSNQNPQGLYWPRMEMQRSEGAEHTKAVMCRTKRTADSPGFKYVRRLYEPDELYDLHADPAELHNRIDDPELADVLAQLKERLLTFYLETCDVVPHDTDRRG